jgi:hypothetical protein
VLLLFLCRAAGLIAAHVVAQDACALRPAPSALVFSGFAKNASAARI